LDRCVPVQTFNGREAALIDKGVLYCFAPSQPLLVSIGKGNGSQ